MFQASDLIYIIPSIVIGMSIHEAMHSLTAHWLGDTTAADMGRLTLNPLKHIDLFTTVLLPVVLILLGLPPIFVAKPVPFNPNRVKYGEYGAALVGLAGPFTNLILAGISALVLRGLAGSSIDVASFWVNLLFYFTLINVSFFIINMIPIPPLDGSRLLYAFAPESVQDIMYKIEGFGFFAILLILLILLPFISPVLDYLINHVLHFLLGGLYPL